MALSNIFSSTPVPEPLRGQPGMNEARIAALEGMTRVPGLMESIQKQQQANPGAHRQWNPAEIQRLLNPNNYQRYDPNAGAYQSVGVLSGSMHHGADFSDDISRWGPGSGSAYRELMRDIKAAENLGNIGYSRDIDTSRGKDNVSYLNQYGVADIDRNTSMDALARSLLNYGVRDLADVGLAQDDQGNPIYYNQRTGKALPEDLFNVQSKKTQTGFGLTVDEKGNIIPVMDSTFTATRAKRLKRNSMAVGALAAFAAPWALPALGAAAGLGTVGAGALYGAGTGALQAGVGGGDVLKGAVVGGVGGGVGAGLGGSSVIKGLGPTMSKVAAGAIRGGLTGGLSAGLYGGDILKGVGTGALAGGAGGLGAAAFGGDPNTLIGKLTGTAGGALGGRIGQQLGSTLIGNPYAQNGPAAQGQQQERPQQGGGLPSWLPEHVQQRLRGMA